jgi:hypothetical protein
VRIKIIEADKQRPMWFNKHLGEVFEVRALRDEMPEQYEVDVSALVKRGELSESCRGIAYVPVAFAEKVEEKETN